MSVVGASGAGTPGVTVTVTPSAVPNGATALTTTPLPPTTDGCTYALKVTPGNYNVTLSATNYLDINQAATPVKQTIQVVAGAAKAVPFTFDNSAIYNLAFANTTAIGRPTSI